MYERVWFSNDEKLFYDEARGVFGGGIIFSSYKFWADETEIALLENIPVKLHRFRIPLQSYGLGEFLGFCVAMQDMEVIVKNKCRRYKCAEVIAFIGCEGNFIYSPLQLPGDERKVMIFR